MQRNAAHAIYHLDPEGRGGRAVVRLAVEQTHGLLEEGVKRLLGREVGLAAGDRRPEEHRDVHRVVMGRAAHQCQLRTHVVADAFELLLALGPCHDVAVAADGAQPLRMGFVQVEVDPLAVDGVGARIGGQRGHVAGRGLQPLERLVVVVEEEHLVINMIAREQQPHGRGEREAAVRAVGREALVAEIRCHALRHRIQIGERVHRDVLVPDAHHPRVEADVLVDRGLPLVREGEVAGQQPGVVRRADDLLLRKPLKPHEARFIEDALHLTSSVHEAREGILVAALPRDDEAPAEDGRGAGLTHPLGRGLRDVEVTGMPQERPLVEVTLVGARQKAPLGAVARGGVALLDEVVLLVDDGVVR